MSSNGNKGRFEVKIIGLSDSAKSLVNSIQAKNGIDRETLIGIFSYNCCTPKQLQEIFNTNAVRILRMEQAGRLEAVMPFPTIKVKSPKFYKLNEKTYEELLVLLNNS